MGTGGEGSIFDRHLRLNGAGPKQVERCIHGGPPKVTAHVANPVLINIASGQAQKDRLRNVLRIGQAPCDAEGGAQHCRVMRSKELFQFEGHGSYLRDVHCSRQLPPPNS